MPFMNPAMMVPPEVYGMMPYLGEGEAQPQQDQSIDILTQLLQQFMQPQQPTQPSEEYMKNARRQAMLAAGAAMLGSEGGDFGAALGAGGDAYSQLYNQLQQAEMGRGVQRDQQSISRLAGAGGLAGDIADIRERRSEKSEDRKLVREQNESDRILKRVQAEQNRQHETSLQESSLEGRKDIAESGDAAAMERIKESARLKEEAEQAVRDNNKEILEAQKADLVGSGIMQETESIYSVPYYQEQETNRLRSENAAKYGTSTARRLMPDDVYDELDRRLEGASENAELRAMAIDAWKNEKSRTPDELRPHPLYPDIPTGFIEEIMTKTGKSLPGSSVVEDELPPAY